MGLVVLYLVVCAAIAIYLLVLATKLVGAQVRSAKALEVIASRLPDTRNV